MNSKFLNFRKKWNAMRWVLPALIVITLLVFFPIFYSFRLSFYRYFLQWIDRVPEFIGWENYINVFHDAELLKSCKILGVMIGIGLPTEFLLGFALALILNKPFTGKRLIVAILTIPYLIAPTEAGLIFKTLYQPQFGMINNVVNLFTGKSIDIDWVGDSTLALYSVTAIDVWRTTPFIMLTLLAGLAAIPGELYEAAEVDRANVFQKFWYITLPLLKWPIMVILMIRIIDLFKFFDIPYILTGGGPGTATRTPSMYIYEVGLRFFRGGYGSALSLVMLAILAIFSYLYVKLIERKRKRKGVI